MNAIYEPKGKAREYAELACNLYIGCTHGCKYCFAPRTMRKTRKAYTIVTPRKNILPMLEKDAQHMRDTKDVREVLFSFISDPFNELERVYKLTSNALQIMRQYEINHTVLTKGTYNMVSKYFDLMKSAKTRLGVSLCYNDDIYRRVWEPNASSVEDRFRMLQEAHEMGIPTWVSLEPVIYARPALNVIEKAHKYVDFWRVGKINYDQELESKVHWPKFREEVISLLDRYKAKYYIKKSLMEFDDNDKK